MFYLGDTGIFIVAVVISVKPIKAQLRVPPFSQAQQEVYKSSQRAMSLRKIRF